MTAKLIIDMPKSCYQNCKFCNSSDWVSYCILNDELDIEIEECEDNRHPQCPLQPIEEENNE